MAITKYVLTDIKAKSYKLKILIRGRQETLVLEKVSAEDCKILLGAWNQKKSVILMHEVVGVGYDAIDPSKIDYIALLELD